MAPSDGYFSRLGAVAAALAIVVYAASVFFHPAIPPHETRAAFEAYAAEPGWGLIHVAELIGILLMCTAAIALAWRLRRGVAGVWAMLAGIATVAFGTVYAIFAAVDGVALGVLVNRWADAGVLQQQLFFESAYAVRQVEAGLFGMQWLLFGLAAGLFAAAFFARAESLFRDGLMSAMAWLSALAGVGAVVFGIVQAQTGFTETSMAFQMGLIPGMLWIIAVGLFLYRHPEDPRAFDQSAHLRDRRHRERAHDGEARQAVTTGV